MSNGYKETKIGQIPEEWETKLIGDFATKFKGGASLKPSDFVNSGTKVLPKLGVVPGGLLCIPKEKQQYCSHEYAEENKNAIVDSDYLIVVLRDLVPSGPSIGLIVRIPDREKYILAQGVYGLTIDTDQLDRDYLIQLSNSIWYRKYMQRILVGSTQVHIRNKEFLKVVIPYPSIDEQQKIAEILSTVDETIEKTDAIIEETRQLKKGLMQKLFTEGIGHTKFKETKIGHIPEKWEVVKLGDVCEGKAKYGAGESSKKFTEGLVRYIRITDINKDGNLNNDMVGIQKENAKDYLLTDGDFLFARTGATVGKTYLYNPKDGECAYAGYLIKFVPKQNILLKYYLNYFCHSSTYWKWINNTARSTAQPNINAAEYSRMRLSLPPIDEQHQIANIFTEVDAKIKKEEATKAELEQLKKGLMQVLLTGKVRVKA